MLFCKVPGPQLPSRPQAQPDTQHCWLGPCNLPYARGALYPHPRAGPCSQVSKPLRLCLSQFSFQKALLQALLTHS